MKSFIGWFKNSSKIKRWMFIIIIGMVLVCYGISKILISDSLILQDLIQIIGTFVIGFVLFIFGLIRIQRRALEIVIEANSTSGDEKNQIDIKTLVSKKNIYQKGPKIVVIGGGAGLNSMLSGLKKYTSNITAIVTVSSYGEVVTSEEKALNLNPVGDIKQSLVALSLKDEEMSKLIDYKFKEGKLKNLSFGDIYLSAMQSIYGDFAGSIDKSSEVLSIIGRVLPVTLDEMRICAELQDGTVVEEKSKISEIVSSKVTKINRVYINPSNCRTAPGIIEAIGEADCIIIAPGSLYTNVIPNLLIKNVSKAIKESKAHKVYISNIMTEPGQTDDYSVSDHIKAIVEHSSEGIVDYCVCDTGEIVPEILRKYNQEGSSLVEVDSAKIREAGITIIKGDYATVEGEYIRHNSDEIARVIVELLLNDLKFKDIKPDEQFMLLNTKLKQANKTKKKTAKNTVGAGLVSARPQKPKPKGTSKFASKYEERIESIRSAEKTREQNIKIHKKAKKMTDEVETEEKEKFIKEKYGKRMKK